DLLRALWPDAFVSVGSLTNLVTEVRTALEEDARSPRYIRTVHSFGYSFVEEAGIDLESAVALDNHPFVRLVPSGDDVGLVEGENLIGRARHCRVRLESSSVSRQHARIVVAAEEVTIEDLGSRNGTIVCGIPVQVRQRLRDGDAICVGSISLIF